MQFIYINMLLITTGTCNSFMHNACTYTEQVCVVDRDFINILIIISVPILMLFNSI